MALFCEDIREEKRDMVSLIGILPDSLNIADVADEGDRAEGQQRHTPLLKLCIYVRINFDVDADIGEPQLRIVMPDGSEHGLGSIPTDTVTGARQKAIEQGNPQAGVIARTVIAPFRFPRGGGVMNLEVAIADAVYLAGALNLRVQTEPGKIISSSADEPPPSQSQPDA